MPTKWRRHILEHPFHNSKCPQGHSVSPLRFLVKYSTFDVISRALCDQVQEVNWENTLDEKREVFIYPWLQPFSGGAEIDGHWYTIIYALTYGKAHQQSCRTDMHKHARRWVVYVCVCACGLVWAIISSSVTREGGGGWREGQRDRSDNRLSDSDKLSSNGSAYPSPPFLTTPI